LWPNKALQPTGIRTAPDPKDRYRTLRRELDIHLKLVALDANPGDLDALAAEMFADQGVGRKTGDARGVLILVDPGIEPPPSRPWKHTTIELSFDFPVETDKQFPSSSGSPKA
jgi:hypothetical protein